MIHKEGYKIIIVFFFALIAFNVLLFLFSNIKILNLILLVGSIVLMLLVVWFFRNPVRMLAKDDNIIYAPADGKVVVIEKVYDKEYFKADRIQVSIFMSPLNVHVNRFPISGEVKYVKYYPGEYLVAWHPKSSEKNERSVVVIEKEAGKEVLLKQIAGAVARRIVTYSKVGDAAIQGEELGFIKFGSRVDLLLPLDAQIKVNIGDNVKGNLDTIATFE